MLLKCIKERYSVRKFKNTPVEEEKIDALIEAARLAPSSRNNQPWKFVIIQDATKREKLTEVCKGREFIAEAPLTIAVCCNNTDYVMTCSIPGYIEDGSIAAAHIALQATELGLGTCWIGAFYQDKAAELINLPEDFKVVVLLPIGYPDVPKHVRYTKRKREIVLYDSF
jgi:nitroreductase